MSVAAIHDALKDKAPKVASARIASVLCYPVQELWRQKAGVTMTVQIDMLPVILLSTPSNVCPERNSLHQRR